MERSLEDLTEEQRQEALALEAVARRAEERAEQRALERAMHQKAKERQQANQKQQERSGLSKSRISSINAVTYVPKKKRRNTGKFSLEGNGTVETSQAALSATEVASANDITDKASGTTTEWTRKDRDSIRQTYLGKTALQQAETDSSKKKQKKTTLRTKKATFRFTWDDTDDTLDADDPLYSQSLGILTKRKRKVSHQSGDDSLKSVHSLHTKPLGSMTSRDWRIIRENYEIVVKGGRAPPRKLHDLIRLI